MQLSNADFKGVVGGSVVLATHEYAPFRGGVATYVREIAGAASRAGVSVEVWTVDYAGRNFSSQRARDAAPRIEPTAESGGPAGSGGFPVVRLRSNGRLTPGGLLALAWGFWRRRDLRGRPIVLLSVGAQMAFFLLDFLGQRPGGRVTCFFHGSEVPRFRRNPLWRQLARRFYRRADAFAATSQYVADLLHASGLLPPGATVARAPCALPEAFRADADSTRPSAAAGSVDDTDDPFPHRVLTVARLHPRKGQLDVARALTLLPPDLRLRVVYQVVGVGDEPYRREVEAACRAGGVRCEFPGGLDDAALGTFYARATVYAQASRTLAQSVEGFGLTFLEAAAYGCPAAAWRSGGVAEAVHDGETGLLVPEGDVPGLSAAIARLLTDPRLRARLGGQARRFAREFRWEASVRTLYGVAVHDAAGPPDLFI